MSPAGSSRHGQSADSLTSKSSNKIFGAVLHHKPREPVGARALAGIAAQPDQHVSEVQQTGTITERIIKAGAMKSQRKARRKVVAYMRTSSVANSGLRVSAFERREENARGASPTQSATQSWSLRPSVYVGARPKDTEDH
jgi:hypothetical protein